MSVLLAFIHVAEGGVTGLPSPLELLRFFLFIQVRFYFAVGNADNLLHGDGELSPFRVT